MFTINNDLLPIFKSHGAQALGVFSFENQESSILTKDLPAFQTWLSEKANAGMEFLEKNLEARKNPSHILPNVKTAIIFLFPYALGHKVRGKRSQIIAKNSNEKIISRYAHGKDYHKVLKKKLTTIAQNLQSHLGESFSFRPVVDSIPFLERSHAREAELGFIRKNTMLIRPGMGSFFFIATLLLDLEVEKFARKSNKSNFIAELNCGTCTKCLDACPTNALVKPYFLDANRCLSYLSIEHRDIVPTQYLSHFANTIYGCDICQDVCPYNLVTSDFEILKEFSEKKAPFLFVTIKEIALMSPLQYEQWFAGTAATRAKYQGLVRNALYHLYATRHIKLKNCHADSELKDILGQLKNSKYSLIEKTVRQLEDLL